MQRIPEPELMNEAEQAQAYLDADFEESHNRFITLLGDKLASMPNSGDCLDLGCGPGDITRRFARAFPSWQIDAVDGSPAMLRLAEEQNTAASLTERIRYFELLLPADEFPLPEYQLVMSSSVLHHLADPQALWSTIKRAAAPGAAVFVMDLFRPACEADARALVERDASDEPEVLQRDFYNSLLAAYLPEEVEEQLQAAGLADLQVEVVSDRHLIVVGHLADV